MKVWKVRIKEVDSDSILKLSLYGDFDRDYVIRLVGLDLPDVEWYELTEEEI